MVEICLDELGFPPALYHRKVLNVGTPPPGKAPTYCRLTVSVKYVLELLSRIGSVLDSPVQWIAFMRESA